MALVALGGRTWFPAIGHIAGTALVAVLIDATAEKVAIVFQVPKTGTLDQFEFRLGTVGVAPVNGLKCSFQDVSLTTGDPDGTIDQFRTVTAGLTSNAWVVPGLITSDGTDTGTKRSVTRGDYLACVIEFASFIAAESLNIAAWGNRTSAGQDQSATFVDHFTAAWAKLNSTAPLIALKYNDGSYGYIGTDVYPFHSALVLSNPGSNTTPDEMGFIFTPTVTMGIGGISFWGQLSGDCAFVLYDTDGSTVLATVTLDKEVRTAGSIRQIAAIFPAVATVVGGSTYRAVLKPTTTSTIAMYDFTVSVAAHLDAHEGGQNYHWTQRTDAGAWSQTTTRRPVMSLLIESVDVPAAGGGLLYHPGMSGGMRG